MCRTRYCSFLVVYFPGHKEGLKAAGTQVFFVLFDEGGPRDFFAELWRFVFGVRVKPVVLVKAKAQGVHSAQHDAGGSRNQAKNHERKREQKQIEEKDKDAKARVVKEKHEAFFYRLDKAASQERP